MKTFKIFLEEKKMSPMTPKEWLKYDWRIEIFLKKFKNKEPFQLTSGKFVTFAYNKQTEADVASRNQSKISAVRLVDTDGNEYRMSAIGKSKEFGGRGAGSGTAKEDMELRSLRDQLNKIKSDTASSTVPVKVGNKTYDIYDVESTPGTPKSDFHLLDKNGKEVVWISHKDGRTAKDFQQYGGISLKAGKIIYDNFLVKSFVKDLSSYVKNNSLASGQSFWRYVPNNQEGNKLIGYSVYGPKWNYGRPGTFNRESVHCIGQGSPILNKTGDGTYALTFSKSIHTADDLTWAFSGQYKAILAVTYRAGRKIENKGLVISNARGGTYPYGFISSRKATQI